MGDIMLTRHDSSEPGWMSKALSFMLLIAEHRAHYQQLLRMKTELLLKPVTAK
jgi:hypothetical protein